MASKSWQAEILAGVNRIPNTGAVPGVLTVLKDNVRSILPGNQVWMAAAEYGKGRVMVLAHEGYLSEFHSSTYNNHNIAQLNYNMKQWLTRGNFVSNTEIGILGSITRDILPHYKILVWSGANGVKNVTSEDLLHFVQNGGSVVHAMCSWGWLQVHAGKSLNDMPFKSFLDKIGVNYQNSAVHIPKDGIDVSHLVPSTVTYKKVSDPSASLPLPPHPISNDQCANGWRSEILAGVDNIPHTGAVPGSLLVYGDQARPILSGSKNIDVWIAASEVGEGRVLVLAHEGYLKDFNSQNANKNLRILHNNMKQWLTKGRFKNGSNIIYSNTPGKTLDSASGSILIWSGQRHVSYTSEEVLNFIISGGALIHATCPWGWKQVNGGISFDEMPMADILDVAGIDYTEKYVQIPAQGLNVCDCSSTDSCHIGLAVDAITTDLRNLSHVGEAVALINEMSESKLKNFSVKLNPLVQLIESPTAEVVPSEHAPVKGTSGKAMMGLCEVLHKTGKMKSKLPGIHLFPGDFTECPNKSTVRLEVQSYLADVHPTGYYAKADEEIAITILNKDATKEGWRLQIGAHSDCLSGSDHLKRWPKVVCSQALTNEVTIMKSTFGGLVYLLSPNGRKNITVQLDNVIEAPLYDVNIPSTAENWSVRRNAPGLWTDLCGEFLIITLPSSSIRDLNSPVEVMQTWDRVLKAHFHLRGSDIRKHRRQWLVTDVQPSVGYMHSGYPVVTQLDVADPSHEFYLLNNESLCNKGSWGVFHEFGHNMQRGVWTFAGTGEVTVNIFTLHAMQMIAGLEPWIHSWLQNQIPATKTYLNSNEDYSKWKSNPGIALFIYAQIAHHFGWPVFKEIFRKYESMDNGIYPNKEQDQIDLWYILLSDITGHNLSPLVDFWKIPLSTNARQTMNKHKAFLPDDEVIGFSKEREISTLQQYRDCIRIPTHLLQDTYNQHVNPPVIQDARLHVTVLKCS
ncbi:TRPM8 channel-associated factor homolog [Patella vulgata]|uniref:TRPM8 channel-associated factor homolog n=1 Tax=Patella vulgata TaxID=6465 RepID=UPI0021804AF4|nr:TRPM8 channel-associated factor homolog [Patella vulgata]